jgi:hypothetical protein
MPTTACRPVNMSNRFSATRKTFQSHTNYRKPVRYVP